MKKILFILLFGAILFFVLYIFSFEKDGAARHLEKWGVGMNIEGFLIENFSSEESGGVSKEVLDARRGSAFVKITKIKTVSPQKYIEDKNFLLNSLFLPTTSPYPGVITNIIECPEEFRPKVKAVENGTVYALFAGDRFNYGVCAQDLVAYFSAYGIFDCPKKGIFEIRIFSKEEKDVGSIIGSFKCANL
ncbi:MAG: hypothetical protein ABIG29_00645 [Candidatus Nealsonbacteria bacterium]